MYYFLMDVNIILMDIIRKISDMYFFPVGGHYEFGRRRRDLRGYEVPATRGGGRGLDPVRPLRAVVPLYLQRVKGAGRAGG